MVTIAGELQRGTHIPASSISVGDACELWYQHRQARGLSAATLRNYRDYLDGCPIPGQAE